MGKVKKLQREIKIGESGYVNKNCWLAKNLKYPPSKRCQYCESKFPNCLFFRYSIVSLILIIFLLVASFLIEGNVSRLVIISIFVLVIVYGYFFDKSTEDIIEANFAQRKAKESFKDLSRTLQQKVEEQTKKLQASYQKVEAAFEIEKEAHKELKRVDEAKSQFIMATQHHLRTPLTALKGYLSMSLEGDFGEVGQMLKEKLGFCFDSTNRLIKLVNEFLDLSKLQLGKDILDIKEASITEMLQDVIAEVKSEADKKGIYLTLTLPEQNIPLAMADPIKLREALYNLIDNAVKYTEKGGVAVRLIIENGKLKIVIQDTGIGMTAEEVKNVFSHQFERGEEAKKVYTLGRGIGLFIAANIITEHKGKVWAESSGRGKGSSFCLELATE